MNDYLLSENIIIIFSVIFALTGFVYLSGIRKSLKARALELLIAGSGLMLFIEIGAVSKLFSLSNIPFSSYILCFILDFLFISLIAVLRKNKRLALTGFASFLAVFALLAITINDYYQYFPTIGSIFVEHYIKDNDVSSLLEAHPKGEFSNSIEQVMFAAGAAKGSVTTVNMPGTLSHLHARPGYVYLPPAYYDKTFSKTNFPALILLTGVPGNPSSWLQGGLLVNTMDSFASHHEGIAPIVVIADHSGSFTNDTECLNSSHGNAETYVTQDVPNYIKSHYRVSNNPNNWGIAGFSEGGMCAAMLTLTHQQSFRHFLDMSGDPDPFLDNYSQTLPVLFHNSRKAQEEHNIDWLLRYAKFQPNLTAQFAIGGEDSKKLRSEMRTTYFYAVHRDIPTSYETIAHSGHDFTTWSEAFNDALPKLSNYLGATECETTCNQ